MVDTVPRTNLFVTTPFLKDWGFGIRFSFCSWWLPVIPNQIGIQPKPTREDDLFPIFIFPCQSLARYLQSLPHSKSQQLQLFNVPEISYTIFATIDLSTKLHKTMVYLRIFQSCRETRNSSIPMPSNSVYSKLNKQISWHNTPVNRFNTTSECES